MEELNKSCNFGFCWSTKLKGSGMCTFCFSIFVFASFVS